MWNRYRRLLRLRGLPHAVAVGALVRLPLPMTPLILLLLVFEQSDSFVTAGVVGGIYGAAGAAGGPLLARSAERWGCSRVLRASAVGHPAALCAFLLSADQAYQTGVIAFAGLAGLTLAPISGVLRAIWSSMTGDEDEIRSIFALDSVVIELISVAGPAVVGLLTWLSDPQVALLGSMVIYAAGALALSRHPHLAVMPPTHGLSSVGVLRSQALQSVLIGAMLSYAAFAVVRVGVSGAAELHSQLWVSGVLIAVWSAASAVFGAVYALSSIAVSPARQLPWLLGAMSAGCLGLAFTSGIAELTVVLVVGAIAVAPTFTVQSVLVSASVPEGLRTRAFAWLSTTWFLGSAGGTALAGIIVDVWGASITFVLAALLMLAGAGWAAGRARRPSLIAEG